LCALFSARREANPESIRRLITCAVIGMIARPLASRPVLTVTIAERPARTIRGR
jgi:hypothetical protein